MHIYSHPLPYYKKLLYLRNDFTVTINISRSFDTCNYWSIKILANLGNLLNSFKNFLILLTNFDFVIN